MVYVCVHGFFLYFQCFSFLSIIDNIIVMDERTLKREFAFLKEIVPHRMTKDGMLIVFLPKIAIIAHSCHSTCDYVWLMIIVRALSFPTRQLINFLIVIKRIFDHLHNIAKWNDCNSRDSREFFDRRGPSTYRCAAKLAVP